MKSFFILKVGTTFKTIKDRFGDFDAWTTHAMGPVNIDTRILDIENGAALPALNECAGAVITGSHTMVTDELPWSKKLEQWIPEIIENRIPLLGICYGHQMLAQATGGIVNYHPRGEEAGTVCINLHPGCKNDILFNSLPRAFYAHVSHSQSVIHLPPEAVLLASNAHEPHHAFRIGTCAWGIQYHPEFTTDIMRAYIEEDACNLTSAGFNVQELINSITETPDAAKVLRQFAAIVMMENGNSR